MAAKNKNPYSLIDAGSLASLASLGQEAIANGEVTPEQALAAAASNPIMRQLGLSRPKLLSASPAAELPGPMMVDAVTEGSVNVPTADPAVFQKIPTPSLAPVAKGSGLQNQLTNQATDEELAKSGGKQTTQSILMMGDPEFAEAYNRAAGSPAIQEQQSGVNEMRDILRMSMEGPTDYLTGPISALLQNEFGRSAAANMQGQGTTPQAARAKLLESMGKIQDDRRDISKQIIESIGKQKAGSFTDVLYQDYMQKKIQEQEAQSTATDPNKMVRTSTGRPSIEADRFVKSFRSQPTVKKAYEAYDAARNILTSTNEKDWVADAQLKASLLKTAGLYPISDRDAAMFAGDPSIAARFNRLVGKLGDGEPLTPQDRSTVQNYAKIIRKKNSAELEKISDNWAKNMGAEYGYSPEKAKSLVREWEGVDEAVSRATAKGGEKMITVISPTGVKGKIPESKLAAALAKKYKRVP